MSDLALLQWKVERYEEALNRITMNESGLWGHVAMEALCGTREQRVGGVFDPQLAGAPSPAEPPACYRKDWTDEHGADGIRDKFAVYKASDRECVRAPDDPKAVDHIPTRIEIVQ